MDHLKQPDACGNVWRTPADRIGDLTVTYDDFYARLRSWGFNVIRLPVTWHNLEPTAPTWDAANSRYIRRWNTNYINDLKSIVSKARANNLGVISTCTRTTGRRRCTASPTGTAPKAMRGCRDAALAQSQHRRQGYDDPEHRLLQRDELVLPQHPRPGSDGDPALAVAAVLLRVGPARLPVQPRVRLADSAAVIGADILNEPYWSYVGGSPPAGQTERQAADVRLRSFYNAIAPAITNRRPSWLLFFQDSTGGYYSADPSLRETPILTNRPSAAGRWVYSTHLYNFGYGTFSDGVPRHDDFGITVAKHVAGQRAALEVPLYIGSSPLHLARTPPR
jgi:hypothetical protein